MPVPPVESIRGQAHADQNIGPVNMAVDFHVKLREGHGPVMASNDAAPVAAAICCELNSWSPER
jgi:hypothetical protein